MRINMNKSETILGWCYLVFQTLILPLVLTIGNLYLPTPFTEGELNILLFAVNFLAVWGIFHKFLWRSLKVALRNPLGCLKAAAWGFAVYYLGNLIVSYLIYFLSPGFFNVNDQTIAGMAQSNYTLVALGVVVLVPVTEEIFYRGLIFGKLYNRSKWAAYVVSTLVFSLLHVTGYIGMYDPKTLILCFLQYLPPSIGLAFAYAKSDTIWTSVLIHTTVNVLGILSMR